MISAWFWKLSMYSNDRHILKEIAFNSTWKSFRDSFVVFSLHFFGLYQLIEIGTSKCLSYFIRLDIKCYFVSSNDEGSACFSLEIVQIHWFVFVCFIDHIHCNIINVLFLLLSDSHQFEIGSRENDWKCPSRVSFNFDWIRLYLCSSPKKCLLNLKSKHKQKQNFN